MTTEKGGAPKGTVNNPNGKNQYAGDLAEKPISIRFHKDVDALLRELPAEERNDLIRNAIASALNKRKRLLKRAKSHP